MKRKILHEVSAVTGGNQNPVGTCDEPRGPVCCSTMSAQRREAGLRHEDAPELEQEVGKGQAEAEVPVVITEITA